MDMNCEEYFLLNSMTDQEKGWECKSCTLKINCPKTYPSSFCTFYWKIPPFTHKHISAFSLHTLLLRNSFMKQNCSLLKGQYNTFLPFTVSKCPSIHPLSFRLSVVGSECQQAKQDNPDFPATFSNSFWLIPRCSQAGRYNSSSMCWVSY